MKIDFRDAVWLNPPHQHRVGADSVEIVTDPSTDLWQRSYYGFRKDNAPALLVESRQNFSFTTRVSFDYRSRFDQCGLIIYLDSQNWFKASIEYENTAFSRLGSVVTNAGYSDWATTDIATPASIWYRLSRRGPDFLIESSAGGKEFSQMRVFHLHALGETTAEMGAADPPLPPAASVRYGLYACSPGDSSFSARFTDFSLQPCLWHAHAADS